MEKTPYFGFALLLAAALLMLPGCALTDQAGHEITIDDRFTAKPLVVAKYLTDRKDLICKELDVQKPCYCFTCKNNTDLKIPLLSKSYDHTLVGGTCSAAYCNQDDYIDYVNNLNSVEMRTFMLGSGQSFVSGGNAGLYCDYTLQLATKWMRGSAGRPPMVPLADRTYCWLGRDMLPLYIYYTGGKEIDPARTAEMAQAFNAADAGPAIITTEAGWDGTDNDAVGKVKNQIEAMQTCKKCIKVLAVKPSDYTAVYNILGVPGNIDTAELAKVDAIGFGFRTNDYPHCDMDQIIFENINFSHYILQKYNKPTIWLYVGASEGNSSAGECTWDASRVGRFYNELMAQTDKMANAGVLGMSLYEFVDRSGPIPCNGVQGCDFGLLNVKGEQKHPELNAWSGMCQKVNAESTARTPLFFSRNGQGGTLCGLNVQNTEAGMGSGFEIGSNSGLATGDVASTPKIKDMGCGEACVSNVTMPKPDIYDGTNNYFTDIDQCKIHPLIDEFADNLDISATYMRATVKIESDFKQFAVSNASKANARCNEKGYTIGQICELAGVAPSDCPEFSYPDDQKPCAYGLTQCIAYPGKAYTDANPYGKVTVPDPASNPGNMPRAIADCGAEKYNPFDTGMSACCGANVLGEALGRARAFVSAYWGSIDTSVCAGGLSEDERHYAEYIIASNRYNGQEIPSVSDFIAQRDNPASCKGEQNYINYILRKAPKADLYGAKVMSAYVSAVKTCGSECPGK